MNTAQLLSQFDRISEAPNAVLRLRRFIVDLAVRGRLVEQDSRDEPASKILERIQNEKALAIKPVKLKLLEPVLELRDQDIPFSIATSWVWARLSNISRRIHYGFTASANESLKTIRFLRITDIQNNSVDWSSVPGCEITEEEVAQYRLDENDILIARTGGTIGKTYLVRNIPVTAVFASYLIRVKPSAKLHAQYLKIFLESSVYWEQLQDGSRGGGQPNVNGQTLGRITVPIPPLAEQHRIVAKVDELMALCDRLEAAQEDRERRRHRLAAASLHHLNNGGDADEFQEHARFYINHFPRLTTRIEHIRQLRQTILNLAVRGKLVPQDPKDEPVAYLLQRIDQTRTLLAKQDRRADGVQMELLASEYRWDVPHTWGWRGLADLALFIDYRGKTPAKTDSGIRLITAKNVRRGLINLEPEEFITEATYNAWMTRGLPRNGDILFTTEAPMGNAAVVRRVEKFGLAQRVIDFRLYSDLDSDFMVLELLSAPFQSILDETATGLTAKGIKAAKLKRLPLAVPPLAEQRRIVAKVQELISLCDRLEAQLTTTRTESRRLLEAVLHQALVPDINIGTVT
jgi:type I restriction enzyme, S subunit